MEFKGYGVGRPSAPARPPRQDGVRQEGDIRWVEKDGRTVRLVTIARPGPPRRPVPAQAVAPRPEAQGPATPLGERQVKAGATGTPDPLPLFGPRRADGLLTFHLKDQLEGNAMGTFTEAVHDIALFHDQGAGWTLAGGGAPTAAWPPSPAFMARVFERVFQPGFTEEAPAKAYADKELPTALLRELLQGLLVPASLLSNTEQLRAVKQDDPFHAEAVRIRKQLLANLGKYELPSVVERTVQALLAGTRDTPRQKAVDTAVVDLLATAASRLEGASYKRLVAAVHAGMKGEAPKEAVVN